MLRKNKVLALFLSAAIITTGLLAGCSSSTSKNNSGDTISESNIEKIPEYLNPAGYPIVKKPLTLKFAGVNQIDLAPWDEIYAVKELEKKTGMHIEYGIITGESIELMLASNDLPDAFYRARLDAKSVVKYGSQGSFISLTTLIDKYGANLKSIFINKPDVKKAITAPDGNIYSLPAIYGYDSPKINNFLWINTKWLSNVGMNMPATLDEYYKVLKAFKTKDANGNGKEDEVPFGGSKDRFMDTIIRGSFGLGANGGGDFQLGKDGKVFYINIDPKYRETIEYLNKLYSEGLIDKDIFTISNTNGKKKVATGVIGSVYNNNPEVAGFGDKKADMVGMPMLKGPYGDQVYSHKGGPVGDVGTFTITSANKYPEATMRWVDFWYSEEGTELLHGGEKGKTYVINSAGNLEYTEFTTKNPDGLTQSQVLGKYTPLANGVPRIFIQKFNKQAHNDPDAVDARSKVAPFAPADAWPQFMYTEQELDVMLTAGNDITQYFNEMQVKFITGAAPMSSWDDYVKQIKQLGLDRVLQVQQAAYDRYNKAK